MIDLGGTDSPPLSQSELDFPSGGSKTESDFMQSMQSKIAVEVGGQVCSHLFLV